MTRTGEYQVENRETASNAPSLCRVEVRESGVPHPLDEFRGVEGPLQMVGEVML